MIVVSDDVLDFSLGKLLQELQIGNISSQKDTCARLVSVFEAFKASPTFAPSGVTILYTLSFLS